MMKGIPMSLCKMCRLWSVRKPSIVVRPLCVEARMSIYQGWKKPDFFKKENWIFLGKEIGFSFLKKSDLFYPCNLRFSDGVCGQTIEGYWLLRNWLDLQSYKMYKSMWIQKYCTQLYFTARAAGTQKYNSSKTVYQVGKILQTLPTWARRITANRQFACFSSFSPFHIIQGPLKHMKQEA